MSDAPNLTFNLRHTVREVTCNEAGHDPSGCSAVHTEFTGDATLTLSGPAALVRQVAATALPFFGAVLDGPPAPVMEHCNWCPTPAAPSLRYHPDGRAHHRESPPAPIPAPVHESHDWAWRTAEDGWCRRCVSDVKREGRTTSGGARPCIALDKSSDDD